MPHAHTIFPVDLAKPFVIQKTLLVILDIMSRNIVAIDKTAFLVVGQGSFIPEYIIE